MESLPNTNSFIPVHPFKPSIGFNIWQGRAANDEASDLYLRPTTRLKTLTLADLPNYGVPAPFRFSVGQGTIHNGPGFHNHAQGPLPSAWRYGRGSSAHLRTHTEDPAAPSRAKVASVYEGHDPVLDQEIGPDNRSQSPSILTSSAVHLPNAQQPAIPSLTSSPAHNTSDVNPITISPRYSQSEASTHDLPSAIPPLNTESYAITTYLLAFILDTVPRQVYLYLLLRLPYLYFSRVMRIFEEAEMTLPQIKQCILEIAIQAKVPLTQPWVLEQSMENVPFKNLQNTWQAFIDSLLREWKTLNIISVLLLSAILTLLQIDDASRDPLTRYAALISMVCALMSLLYGCIYIIRFGTMRKSYKAAEWANEAQKTTQSIIWNIWVLLAMPATWLAWSIILFLVCIMSFVWRTGTVDDNTGESLTRGQVLGGRIIVTLVLLSGLVYLGLIITTLRRYGEMMDRAWHRRILDWANDASAEKVHIARQPAAPFSRSWGSLHSSPNIGGWGWDANVDPATNLDPLLPRKPNRSPNREVVQTVISATQPKMVTTINPTVNVSSGDLRSNFLPQKEQSEYLQQDSENEPESPGVIEMLELYRLSIFAGEIIDVKSEIQLSPNDKVWDRLTLGIRDIFEADLRLSWDAHFPERILPILDKFNEISAVTIGGQLALCQKFWPTKAKYAIFFFFFNGSLPREQSRYDSIPSDLDRLDIWLSPSTSSDPGTYTETAIVSLSSKCSLNTQSTSIILPIAQPDMKPPSEDMK